MNSATSCAASEQATKGTSGSKRPLCETASLYVLRGMARTWKTSPPYPNWKDYRDSLRDYADDIMRKRDGQHEIFALGMPAFYRNHRSVLEKEPTSRELNGAMAIVLLQLFEEQPERWEAVRWLNSTPPRKGDSFAIYLRNWHDAAPPRHQAFVSRIAKLYGVTIKTAAVDK